MKKILFLLPLLLGLDAGETSNHNDIILPYNEAVARCHDKGQDWKREQPSVTQHLDSNGITATITKVVRVICIVPESVVQEPTVQVKVSWSAPEFKENGDPLPLTDLAGYEIYVYDTMGSFGMFPAEGEEWIREFEPGTYQISMLAADTDGLKSEMTDPIEITVAVPE